MAEMRQFLLSQASRRIHAAGTLADALAILADEAVGIVGAHQGFASLISEAGTDWTIAAVLAHLAYWDEWNLVRWRKYRETGEIAAVSSMATIDMINEAALPAQRALDPHTAVALARSGETVWAMSQTSTLHMRALAPEFIGRYLAAAGDEVLSSVGAYQLEGIGIQLFDRIDGDYFAILGLPLLPLLDALRREGAIEG